MRAFLLLPLLALSAPVFAQTTLSPPPRARVAPPADEQPALDTGKTPRPAEAGTTIVGDNESPIGLYITPWRESHAEKDIDRPARLLQEEMLPIDKDVFERQVEYYDALSNAAQHKASAK